MPRIPVIAAVLVLLAAPVGTAVLPANVYVQNDHELPTRLPVGGQQRVDLAVRYDYTASSGQVEINLSMAESPSWMTSVEFIPQQFVVTPEPGSSSVRRNVTAVFRTAPDAPGLLAEKAVLHLEARSDQDLSTATNEHEWFATVRYRPSLSAQLTRRPIILPPGGTESARLQMTNLGNAPVRPRFRFIRIPSGVQAGIAWEGGILGTEVEHRQNPVRDEATIVVQDRGGGWDRQVIPIEITTVPTRGSRQLATKTRLDVVVFRETAVFLQQVLMPATVLAGAAVGGIWYYSRRQAV